MKLQEHSNEIEISVHDLGVPTSSATLIRKSPVIEKDYAENIFLTKARKPSAIKAEEAK